MHSFKLTYDSRKVKAVLTIRALEEPVEVTVQDVLSYLEEVGITTGLNVEAIEKMIDKSQWDQPVLVAKGAEPVNGKDGWLEYNFDTNPDHTPHVRADGSVDFYNINVTAQVHKDDILSTINPPTKGEPGEDVFGVPIPSRSGKDVIIVPGQNTVFADLSKTIIKSVANGHAELNRDKSVKVIEVFTVRGDIDYGTGNLDFDGDLEILGDVKSGFSVKASGNIEIYGTVEDAVVESGGNVIVRGGYIGSGKGSVQSGQDAIFRFVRNQQVIAERDIYVYEESMHAKLSAGRGIIMNKGRGQIVGGFAEAGRFVEINVVGNEKYIQTRINICEDSSLSIKIESQNNKLRQLKSNQDKLEPMLLDLRKKKKENNLPEEMTETYNHMERVWMDLSQSIKKTADALRVHAARMTKRRSGMYVRVMDRIYPETIFSIAGSIHRNETILGASQYMLGGKEVIVKMAQRKERGYKRI